MNHSNLLFSENKIFILETMITSTSKTVSTTTQTIPTKVTIEDSIEENGNCMDYADFGYRYSTVLLFVWVDAFHRKESGKSLKDFATC